MLVQERHTGVSKIGIVGLGYVGLPLAIAFSRGRSVVGYDKNPKRIEQLKRGLDVNSEVSKEVMSDNTSLNLTNKPEDLFNCNTYVITVPTPIDQNNDPDLRSVQQASELVGSMLESGNVVIYESTVYPGVTDDFCTPILESQSKLKINKDFGVGYSPERINPGDTANTLDNIVKVTSGSNEFYADYVDNLYSEIITAGTFKAANIKTAEAAKITENTQRDVNIALMNELSKIFQLIGIDTIDVIDAASSKWNFLRFTPGLVGGHCIGVDPYYLAYRSEQIGYRPNLILDARYVNNSLPKYIVEKIQNFLVIKKMNTEKLKALILGAAFKENCPDSRNSKTLEIIKRLHHLDIDVTVFDPVLEDLQDISFDIKKEYSDVENLRFDILILAVPHDLIMKIGDVKLLSLAKEKSIIIDLKSKWERQKSDFRL